MSFAPSETSELSRALSRLSGLAPPAVYQPPARLEEWEEGKEEEEGEEYEPEAPEPTPQEILEYQRREGKTELLGTPESVSKEYLIEANNVLIRHNVGLLKERDELLAEVARLNRGWKKDAEQLILCNQIWGEMKALRDTDHAKIRELEGKSAARRLEIERLNAELARYRPAVPTLSSSSSRSSRSSLSSR